VRVVVRGVNTVRKRLADGSVRIFRYHRESGIRLSGDPGTPEFILSWAKAEQSRRDRLEGTLSGLLRNYTMGAEFTEGLAASTQKSYRRSFRFIEAAFGDMPVAALNNPEVRKDFVAWQRTVARSSGPREADNRLSALSAALTWAADQPDETLGRNNLRGFKRLHHADRSEKVWLPEHIEAMMRAAPVELQQVLIVALHTGLRQGDIRRLSWAGYDGKRLSLRIHKNQRGGVLPAPVKIPCSGTLRRMLDRVTRSGPLILTTANGRAWQARHLNKQWAAAFKRAGLSATGLHFNDLRGTAITKLAEAGCTIPQICAITMHKPETAAKILGRYLAKTPLLADQAISLFENAKETEFANRLQTGPQKVVRKRASGGTNAQ
jgi:integrase